MRNLWNHGHQGDMGKRGGKEGELRFTVKNQPAPPGGREGALGKSAYSTLNLRAEELAGTGRSK